MPFIQFINGSRDQEFEELNPAASLVLGSGADAHIQVSDPGVEAAHCQLYPAQGAFWLRDMGSGQTIFEFKRLANNTTGLKPGDVFIVGRTFVKFWPEKPAGAGAGGGGGGGDPAAQQRAKELEGELGAARARVGELEGELSAAKGELEQATRAREQAEGELSGVRGELEQARGELEQARADGAQQQARVRELEGELEQARAEGERRATEAQEQARQERAELEGSLEATRAALEGLRGEAEARQRDRLAAASEPSDLEAALEALALPDAARRRVEQAVQAHVDREVLRRSAGPVIPLRDLALPGSGRDLAADVAAVRLRAEQVEAARRLELGALDAAEVERLLEMARS